MQKCYIGLGSNLENPLRQVTQALELIGKIEDTQIQQCSPWVESYAVGPGEQPNFVNGVVEVETALTPQQLLEQLQMIEQCSNRKRVIRWGPRTLDLDILLYGQQTIKTETVVIPHPHLTERDFVVIPLMSIAQDLILPSGEALTVIAERLSINNGRTQNCWPLQSS